MYKIAHSYSVQDDAVEIEEHNPPPSVCHWVFIFPTICDLAGTTFGGIGLLYTSASVWQMFRGSIIVFSAILSMIFLKRKLQLHNWVGMLILVGGLIMVGLSSLSTNGDNSKSLVLGIVFILLGQLTNAIQMVVEESFIKSRNYPPLNVVGMEGLFGTVLMALVILPALYFVPNVGMVGSNFHDDSLDAMVQMSNSTILLVFIFLYLLSIAFYNFFGLSVTKQLTAVHRTLIDACRTICVWVTEIVLYYAVSNEFGEAWNMPWSFLQLGGFVLLVFGTLVYNAILKIPGSNYERPDQAKQPLISVTATVGASNKAT